MARRADGLGQPEAAAAEPDPGGPADAGRGRRRPGRGKQPACYGEAAAAFSQRDSLCVAVSDSTG